MQQHLWKCELVRKNRGTHIRFKIYRESKGTILPGYLDLAGSLMLPFRDGLQHLFIVLFGLVYSWVYHMKQDPGGWSEGFERDTMAIPSKMLWFVAWKFTVHQSYSLVSLILWHMAVSETIRGKFDHFRWPNMEKWTMIHKEMVFPLTCQFMRISPCHVWLPEDISHQIPINLIIGPLSITINNYQPLLTSITIWLFNIAMENHHFKRTVNHHFLWAIYTMAMLVITRG